MKKYAYILLGMFLLTACYKDEIDVDSMTNNPFDREYEGPDVFQFETTYLQTVTIQGIQTVQQVVEFSVREELFLTPTTYSVRVKAQMEGAPSAQFISPDPPGSNIIKYITAPASGQTICFELSLANNLSSASAEVICVNL